MGHQVKRVPLDFDWQINKAWSEYPPRETVAA